jgi:hypothetical protein
VATPAVIGALGVLDGSIELLIRGVGAGLGVPLAVLAGAVPFVAGNAVTVLGVDAAGDEAFVAHPLKATGTRAKHATPRPARMNANEARWRGNVTYLLWAISRLSSTQRLLRFDLDLLCEFAPQTVLSTVIRSASRAPTVDRFAPCQVRCL